MGLLVNIDNGGTLTDICVIDGDQIWRTKTLTTPHDLSKCLMEGLEKASTVVFGEPDLERLLAATEHVRYSTTQGTNALVERKGPRLGLVLAEGVDIASISGPNSELFEQVIGDRIAVVPEQADEDRRDVVRAVSELGSTGANRIIVGFSQEDAEVALKRALLRAFPAHLLGAVPILYSFEADSDPDDPRRIWTAIFNAFLHPAMERFLYSAEQKLRSARAKRPLLIFRNDGLAARVSKTVAIKTYSSGPRGGAEGACALAGHYGVENLVSVDIGGTTTDVSVVENGRPHAQRHGRIESVETSIPLLDVTSYGVGGSSIIRVRDGAVTVGPDSVGSAPGPACFGLGGEDATITDALFASGVLDPTTYFGGEMAIDVERARAAVRRNVAEPLGVDEAAALIGMEKAWVGRVADSVRGALDEGGRSTLTAFGGAGPLLVCSIANHLGVSQVILPKLAPVFSAFGVGFSDLGHTYETALADAGAESVSRAAAELRRRAELGMTAEGVDASSCRYEVVVLERSGSDERVHATDGASAVNSLASGARLALRLTVTKPLPRPQLTGRIMEAKQAATAHGEREIRINGVAVRAPVYDAASLGAGDFADGPAILEDQFYTCRIDEGWRITANETGDMIATTAGVSSVASDTAGAALELADGERPSRSFFKTLLGGRAPASDG